MQKIADRALGSWGVRLLWAIAAVALLGWRPAAAQNTVDRICPAPSACWTLQVQLADLTGPDSAKNYAIKVYLDGDPSPRPAVVNGTVTTIQLPRHSPDEGGFYFFRLEVRRGPDVVTRVDLQSPAYVNLGDVAIPVYVTPAGPLFRANVHELSALASNNQYTDRILWKAFFQSQLALDRANKENDVAFFRDLRRAVFNACSALARNEHTMLLFQYDRNERTCLTDPSVVTETDLVDARTAHWLLYDYCNELAEAWGPSKAHKSDYIGLFHTMVWLGDFLSSASDQHEVERLAVLRPIASAVAPSAEMFKTLLERLKRRSE